jgi:translation initiation factor 3 subunit B
LLSKEQQRLIRKNLCGDSRLFDEEDFAIESSINAESMAHRLRLVEEWNAWRARCKKEAPLGNDPRKSAEKDTEEIEMWVEDLLEEVEEVVE